MNKTKQIEIGGKIYTLTSKRSIIVNMGKYAPELLNINKNNDENARYELGAILYDNMNNLFYEMIKVEHPNLSKEESDNIYEDFCNEYNDVEEHLLEFIDSTFTEGIPRENKKTIIW